MYVGKTLEKPSSEFMQLIQRRRARELDKMPKMGPNDLAPEAKTLRTMSLTKKKYRPHATFHEKEIILNAHKRLNE